jgi:hypothetical protein
LGTAKAEISPAVALVGGQPTTMKKSGPNANWIPNHPGLGLRSACEGAVVLRLSNTALRFIKNKTQQKSYIEKVVTERSVQGSKKKVSNPFYGAIGRFL